MVVSNELNLVSAMKRTGLLKSACWPQIFVPRTFLFEVSIRGYTVFTKVLVLSGLRS